MRKMKDSGVDWIGEIPGDWKIVRGKWILRKMVRPILVDDEIVTCFRDGEVTLRSKRRKEGFTIALNETGYQGIEPGDLIVHGMDGFAGAIGISDSRGKSSPVLNVLDSNQNKRYLKYYLRCMAYMGIFESLSTGIRIRTCDTNWNKLKELYYLEPNYEEQEKIANYLDEKINIIDKTLVKIRETIQEYKNLKSRIVIEAITKGINKNNETKYSGIKEIGSIPKNWKIEKLKYILSNEKDNLKVGPFGSALTSSDFKEEGMWVYNQRSVLDNNFETNNTFIDKMKYKELEGFKIATDDILITTRGSIGKIAIVPKDAPIGIIHPCIIRFRIDRNKISYELLKYIFNESDFILNQIKIKSNSTTIDVLYSQTLKEVYLPIIPNEESKEILRFLDNKCYKIDLMIERKEKMVKELEEYKKSLIYEYVTGKKEVDEKESYSAENIAEWILNKNAKNRSNGIENDGITNLKLQKLLYYAEGIYYTLKHKNLIKEEFVAWKHGPVVRNIYYKYNSYKANEINTDNINNPKIDKETENVLEKMYSKYSQYTAEELRNMTHQESPWKKTSRNKIIEKDLIKNYFENEYKWEQ